MSLTIEYRWFNFIPCICLDIWIALVIRDIVVQVFVVSGLCSIVLVIRDFVLKGFVVSGLCSSFMHVTTDGLNNTVHCSGPSSTPGFQCATCCDRSTTPAPFIQF